jgi:hypothetical protein
MKKKPGEEDRGKVRRGKGSSRTKKRRRAPAAESPASPPIAAGNPSWDLPLVEV